MARLFITQREISFINDLAKEMVKDIAGQKIYYYSISEVKTQIHDIYEESPDKIFDTPIEIDCFVQYQEQEIRTNQFGSEEFYNIECFIQKKDLLDKGIEINEGDFFSYGSVFFEVIKAPTSSTIYGQIEYGNFITVTGRQARKRQFLSKVFGPTSERFTDSDAIQDTFVQQRGFETNKNGETGDIRDLQKKGVLDAPLTGPKEVSPKGDKTGAGSSFYDEE